MNDLSPLAECKDLETLIIPEQIKDGSRLGGIRKLPNLKFLDYLGEGTNMGEGRPPHKMLTVDEFFVRYGGGK